MTSTRIRDVSTGFPLREKPDRAWGVLVELRATPAARFYRVERRNFVGR